jgi:hypothetical protein
VAFLLFPDLSFHCVIEVVPTILVASDASNHNANPEGKLFGELVSMLAGVYGNNDVATVYPKLLFTSAELDPNFDIPTRMDDVNGDHVGADVVTASTSDAI